MSIKGEYPQRGSGTTKKKIFTQKMGIHLQGLYIKDYHVNSMRRRKLYKKGPTEGGKELF